MTVPVFVPVKDCAMWLPRFLGVLDKMKGVDRVVFSYGKSRDLTLTYILQFKESSRHKVEVYEEPRKLNALSSAQIAAIYRDFQTMMTEDDTHVLLLDSDIIRAPTTLISKLMRHDKDIIAPYVYVQDYKPLRFFDAHVFRKDGFRFFPWAPPNYLDKKPVQIDSVGTCMLVKKEVFEATPYGDPYPHLRFCNESRMKGYEVWADPVTKIYHVDLSRFGIQHHPIEVMMGLQPENTPFMDDEGKQYDIDGLSIAEINAHVWGKHNP